ncbi:MAG TPA: hypothetical protein VHW66_19155 [Stellaceae bacterium]|jgi:hypothetical protein|nr:hypothetical protein [Stellaceae bacterium]
MPSADWPDDVKPLPRRRRSIWDGEAIETLRRVRRRPIPLRDMIALVLALALTGIMLGAHYWGHW